MASDSIQLYCYRVGFILLNTNSKRLKFTNVCQEAALYSAEYLYFSNIDSSSHVSKKALSLSQPDFAFFSIILFPAAAVTS